jgi:hypothetical protein
VLIQTDYAKKKDRGLSPVDSFKFLPRLIAAFYQMTERQLELPIPWAPLARPLPDCKFGLVTSGRLYHRGIEPPFDLARERQDHGWDSLTFSHDRAQRFKDF